MDYTRVDVILLCRLQLDIDGESCTKYWNSYTWREENIIQQSKVSKIYNFILIEFNWIYPT